MNAQPQKLPGRPSLCRACKAEIRWATTLATPNGPGGRAMPLDAFINDAGNVAVRAVSKYRLVARVLGKGETHDTFTEVRAMPHFPTCKTNQAADLVTGIEALLEAEATRKQEATS